MCRPAAPSLRDEREARDETDVVIWFHFGAVDEVTSHGDSKRVASTKHILLFVVDFVSVEERAVFLLERLDAMMFALIADVLLDLRDLGFADRERRIAILPGE